MSVGRRGRKPLAGSGGTSLAQQVPQRVAARIPVLPQCGQRASSGAGPSARTATSLVNEARRGAETFPPPSASAISRSTASRALRTSVVSSMSASTAPTSASAAAGHGRSLRRPGRARRAGERREDELSSYRRRPPPAAQSRALARSAAGRAAGVRSPRSLAPRGK